MRFLAILASLIFLAAPVWAAPSSDCSTIAVTNGFDEYILVGTRSLSVSFEPDSTGSETTATVSLKMCSSTSADSCLDYDFDSNGDNVPDTNILTGGTTPLSGVAGVVGFNYLRIEDGTPPSGTDTPEVTICREGAR